MKRFAILFFSMLALAGGVWFFMDRFQGDTEDAGGKPSAEQQDEVAAVEGAVSPNSEEPPGQEPQATTSERRSAPASPLPAKSLGSKEARTSTARRGRAARRPTKSEQEARASAKSSRSVQKEPKEELTLRDPEPLLSVFSIPLDRGAARAKQVATDTATSSFSVRAPRLADARAWFQEGLRGIGIGTLDEEVWVEIDGSSGQPSDAKPSRPVSRVARTRGRSRYARHLQYMRMLRRRYEELDRELTDLISN